MSDYNEYAQYYKIAWEKSLNDKKAEAEEVGFNKVLEVFKRNGLFDNDESVPSYMAYANSDEGLYHWLLSNRERILKGTK
jgi:hypothetical protein